MSPTTSETLESLFVRVYKATMRGVLAWEETANANILIAPLGEEYSVKLETVPDLEGHSSDPDRTLTLLRESQPVYTLTRLDLNAVTLVSALGAEDISIVAYRKFEELWARAEMRARRVDEALEKANQLLDARLREGEEGSRR